MGIGKKFRYSTEKVHGKGKEAAGVAAGNKRLRAEDRGH